MNATKHLICRIAVAALVGAAVPASAQVSYDFTAFSSIPVNGETFSGSFSVNLPDFVTGNTTVPLAAMSSCTVDVSPAATASCRQALFLFDISPPLVTISFDVETQANVGTGIYYYFESDAFGSVGTHESVLLGRDQAGRLVVTAVPEPAQWAMLALGFGVLGLAARRRRMAG